METPIYELIKEAINEDGILSADFSLPKKIMAIKFALQMVQWMEL